MATDAKNGGQTVAPQIRVGAHEFYSMLIAPIIFALFNLNSETLPEVRQLNLIWEQFLEQQNLDF